jgi:hypothetical protein
MLAAPGRSADLKGHIRAAISNGATVAETREVFINPPTISGLKELQMQDDVKATAPSPIRC